MRYVGDHVAVVVADSMAAAKDAAELVDVDYGVLPAVVDIASALSDGAPLIHDDAPGNQCYDWEMGDKAATDAAFAGAQHVVKLDLVNNRLIPKRHGAARGVGRV